MFEFLENRTAELVAEALLRRVRFVHGVPKHFRSDSAQEFVGNVITILGEKLGVEHQQTHGYHPEGNSRVERVHRYLGRCIKDMTDEQYHKIKAELPRVAWGWNVHEHDTIGMSPFAWIYGREAITLSQALIQRYDGKPTPGAIFELAEEYRSLAKTHAAYMRKLYADRLNARSAGGKTEFDNGDLVRIYVPPGQDEIERRGRKAKHLYCWRGPCEVIEVLTSASGTKAYRTKHKITGRVFTRTIVNVEEWKGTSWTAPSPLQPDEFNLEMLQVGDIAAVIDDKDDRAFHLIEVTEIGDNVKGLIYVQKNARNKQSSLKSLKLYEGWQRSNVMLIPPKGNLSAYTRYNGSFKLTRDSVLVSGVKFLPSGSRKQGFKLSAAAVSKLQPFWDTGLRYFQTR